MMPQGFGLGAFLAFEKTYRFTGNFTGGLASNTANGFSASFIHSINSRTTIGITQGIT